MKHINIEINREDKHTNETKETSASHIEKIENAVSQEDLYAKELEMVLDRYIEFKQTYKDVSKKMMNPIRMRRESGLIYEELKVLSQKFNQTIQQFVDNAQPPEDLRNVHLEMLQALEHFKIYNDEFPDLMLSGKFKRINQLSEGLKEGQNGINRVFLQLEEREKKKLS